MNTSIRSINQNDSRQDIHHPQRPTLLPDFIATPDDSSPDETESSSYSCGPQLTSSAVENRLQLLPTPDRSDAATFDYEAVDNLDGDFHPAGCAPARAHGRATLPHPAPK